MLTLVWWAPGWCHGHWHILHIEKTSTISAHGIFYTFNFYAIFANSKTFLVFLKPQLIFMILSDKWQLIYPRTYCDIDVWPLVKQEDDISDLPGPRLYWILSSGSVTYGTLLPLPSHMRRLWVDSRINTSKYPNNLKLSMSVWYIYIAPQICNWCINL